DVFPLRLQLQVRMPSFNLTHDEARAIVAWFREAYDVPQTSELFDADTLVKAHATEGKKIFNETIQCYKCHPAGGSYPSAPTLSEKNGIEPGEIPVSAPADSFFVAYKSDANAEIKIEPGFATPVAAKEFVGKLPAGTLWAVGAPWSHKLDWGPDLAYARERLRPSWLRDWLINPDDFMPGTKMSKFFGARAYFAGSSDAHLTPEQNQQIRDVIQYLVHMEALQDGGAPAAGGGGK
ncbi:MAG: hypothetical protein AAF517_11490, partial [Planctomycetota bacterium]